MYVPWICRIWSRKYSSVEYHVVDMFVAHFAFRGGFVDGMVLGRKSSNVEKREKMLKQERFLFAKVSGSCWTPVRVKTTSKLRVSTHTNIQSTRMKQKMAMIKMTKTNERITGRKKMRYTLPPTPAAAIIWEADTEHCLEMAPDLVEAKTNFIDCQRRIEKRVWHLGDLIDDWNKLSVFNEDDALRMPTGPNVVELDDKSSENNTKSSHLLNPRNRPRKN
ncbi:hypothetical protein G7Y89_g13663 [Cudoniella acicularis]|uniref:Uncharacterized protein n=1 Tax=Cudoniella acicularis TaxID=354080 RepID=A0A8H4VW77_9HELO|nr:hypothetical protein G7Y89_g13663 [Cudoniella acicularis]